TGWSSRVTERSCRVRREGFTFPGKVGEGIELLERSVPRDDDRPRQYVTPLPTRQLRLQETKISSSPPRGRRSHFGRQLPLELPGWGCCRRHFRLPGWPGRPVQRQVVERAPLALVVSDRRPGRSPEHVQGAVGGVDGRRCRQLRSDLCGPSVKRPQRS